MTKQVIRLTWIINTLFANGLFSCSTHICFTWRVSKHNLTLICTVDNLRHFVYIYDPSGHVQADCLPPDTATQCDPYFPNGTIIQNRKTNETIFTVEGKIDNRLNGIWTCRHGTNKESAIVEVTVLNYSVTNVQKVYQNIECCIRTMFLVGSMTFVATLTIVIIVLSLLYRRDFIKDETVSSIFRRLRRHHGLRIFFDRRLKTLKSVLVCKSFCFATVSVVLTVLMLVIGYAVADNCSVWYISLLFGLVCGLFGGVIPFVKQDHLKPEKSLEVEDEAHPMNVEVTYGHLKQEQSTEVENEEHPMTVEITYGPLKQEQSTEVENEEHPINVEITYDEHGETSWIESAV